MGKNIPNLQSIKLTEYLVENFYKNSHKINKFINSTSLYRNI